MKKSLILLCTGIMLLGLSLPLACAAPKTFQKRPAKHKAVKKPARGQGAQQSNQVSRVKRLAKKPSPKVALAKQPAQLKRWKGIKSAKSSAVASLVKGAKKVRQTKAAAQPKVAFPKNSMLGQVASPAGAVVPQQGAQKIQKTGPNCTTKSAQQSSGLFIPYQEEKQSLIKEFDNKLSYQGMLLHFSYDHVFQGDFYPNGSLGGLHHDWQNHLEKQGLVTFGPNKRRLANGIYRVTVYHQGVPNDKTFYPAHWSRKKVLRKVFEAFNNQVPAIGSTKNGRVLVEGLTSEGIRIRFIIDQTGKVVTFFPVS